VVRAGWALAYRRYAKDYIEAENQAERAGRGIWQGSFTRPEIWRREQRKK
jgi:endonuclease YncB( thermonuclease family)